MAGSNVRIPDATLSYIGPIGEFPFAALCTLRAAPNPPSAPLAQCLLLQHPTISPRVRSLQFCWFLYRPSLHICHYRRRPSLPSVSSLRRHVKCGPPHTHTSSFSLCPKAKHFFLLPIVVALFAAVPAAALDFASTVASLADLPS